MSNNIIKLLICILALNLIFCSQDNPAGVNQTDRDYGVQINSYGWNRTFWIHLPPNLDTTRAVPLVIVFHGAGDNGLNIKRFSDFDKVADDLNVVMVYPDAAHENWAEGIGARADKLGINDVGFVKDIINKLHADLNIDLNRVYAVGFSQGGFFTHRLVVDLWDKITAYATVASSMSIKIGNRYFTPGNMPVLLMHGTSDPIFNWYGVSEGFFAYLSQRDVLQKVRFNNTSYSDSIFTNVASGSKEVYMNENDEKLVEFYIIENGGHSWPTGNINTPEVILNFFMKFQKK